MSSFFSQGQTENPEHDSHLRDVKREILQSHNSKNVLIGRGISDNALQLSMHYQVGFFFV